MTTINIDDRYVSVLSEFTDLDTAVNAAIKRYVINSISDKIAILSSKSNEFIKKYEMTFDEFINKTSSNEQFIDFLENEKQLKMWEFDLNEWEFCIKGIEDWKQKLQSILTI